LIIGEQWSRAGHRVEVRPCFTAGPAENYDAVIVGTTVDDAGWYGDAIAYSPRTTSTCGKEGPGCSSATPTDRSPRRPQPRGGPIDFGFPPPRRFDLADHSADRAGALLLRGEWTTVRDWADNAVKDLRTFEATRTADDDAQMSAAGNH
jgi:hypothetical protein